MLPLTGDAAQWGIQPKKAIDLAVEEINHLGGLNGRKVKVVYEDDKCLPTLGTQAVNKLIHVDKVKVIIGPVCSSVTLAVAPITEKEKVIVISPASTSHKITEAGDYIFRTIVSDVYEGSKMAEFAYGNLNVKKVSIITINTAGTRGMADSFKSKFEELGGKVLTYEVGEQGQRDFRTELSKGNKEGVEAFYLVGYSLEIGHMVLQARELGIKTKLLSCQPAEDPQVREIAKQAVEGVIFTTTTLNPEESKGLVEEEFFKRFQERYREKPGSFAPEAYDAINLILSAIKEVSYEPNKIRDFLYGVRNYKGASGTFSFDEKGDVVKPIQLRTFKEGKIVKCPF